MRVIVFGFLLISTFASFSQWVRDDDTSKVYLTNGIYMTETDFLTNTPNYSWLETDPKNWVYKDSLHRKSILLEVTANPEIEKNLRIRERFIIVRNDSGKKVIERMDIWGICVNGTPYRYVDKSQKDNFILIHISGVISYLSYTAIYEDPFYWSVGHSQIDEQYQNEVVDLVVDFEKPALYRNTRKNLEEVIARDVELYEEYEKEKKKSKAIYRYIIRYNKRHPLVFDDLPENVKQNKP